MKPEPRCPRCGGSVRPPGLWSSDWRCERHGAVLPFTALPRCAAEALDQVAAPAKVPLWLPYPLPTGWLITGVAYAGDQRRAPRRTAVACSGPAPLGGGADLVIVAEEPGIGLGANYAGLDGPDPGTGFDADAPHAKVEAAGHPTPLWALPGPDDRAVYVGEAKGLWLWAVLWPADAGVLLVEHLELADLRDRRAVLEELPYGARTPRLCPPPRD